MEEGRRLENLSWRLWNLETFCTSPQIKFHQRRIDRMRPGSKDIPELSTSVDSAVSDTERIEAQIKSPPQALDYKPKIVGEDPMLSVSRGRDRHITSIGLEKMVYKIKEKKSLEPIATLPTPLLQEQSSQEQSVDITPRAASPTPNPKPWKTVKPHRSTESCSTAALDANDSENSRTPASDTSVSSVGMVKSSSIVRGFSPSHISSSYRSNTKLSSGLSTSKPLTAIRASPLKKKNMFTLGGSSGDDESSFEDRMAIKPHRSSLTDGLHQASLQKPSMIRTALPSEPIKPIKENTEDEDAIETDDDDIPESAIDDDSDWEDSVTESGRSSLDEKELFQRVDSRPNLVSRPSLLTMMMHQPQHTMVPGRSRNHNNSRSTPALQRSRLTSPNRQSSEDDDDENNLTMKGPEVPRSKPIVVKSVPAHSIAHSPRTTRRNMLATELTESLRRHLIWERQQKAPPAATAFQRRHTAHDMANLHDFPRPSSEAQQQTQTEQQQTQPNRAIAPAVQQLKDKETSKNNSWNHYFEYGPWEYHVKGW